MYRVNRALEREFLFRSTFLFLTLIFPSHYNFVVFYHSTHDLNYSISPLVMEVPRLLFLIQAAVSLHLIVCHPEVPYKYYLRWDP